MNKPFNSSHFRKLNKAKQIDFMRDWFLERYEDPAQHTPYDSGEGGYIWIYGGPFEAEEVLTEEFEESAKRGAIEELSDELNSECWTWTRTQRYDDQLFPHEEDEHLYEFDGTLNDYEIIIRLQSSLSSLESLLKQAATLKASEKLFSEMMTFSFCITFLESYLSDIFASLVLKNTTIQKNYLKNDKVLSVTKFSLGELFDKHDNIGVILKKRLSETSFHNLPLIKSLFQAVLGLDVGEIGELKTLVDKRHDFIHRGGKDKNGKLVKTSTNEIRDLMKKIENFCLKINGTLEHRKLIEPAPF